MKINSLLLLALLLAFSGNAQLKKEETIKDTEVGKVKILGQTIAELSYRVIDTDTIYYLLYKNQKYTQLTDFKVIKFDGVDDTKEAFYNVLKSFFTDPEKSKKGYKETITLGETRIILTKRKDYGIEYVELFTTDGYFNIQEKWLNKLFGKEK